MAQARRQKHEPNEPVSVLIQESTRANLVAEARRRGLGLSTTIRTLAQERLLELEEDRQLARALRWQRTQVWASLDRIRAGQGIETSQTEIDATVARALARATTKKRRG